MYAAYSPIGASITGAWNVAALSIWRFCCYSDGTDRPGRHISLSSHYQKDKGN